MVVNPPFDGLMGFGRDAGMQGESGHLTHRIIERHLDDRLGWPAGLEMVGIRFLRE